jgi:6-phosphogluconate dehydrogenase
MKVKSYIIMGVSGSGKTTVGKLLAEKLDLPFYDADAFHPQANIDKMSQGTPLDDNDRRPWLETLQQVISNWEEGGVLACSALKESYRELLSTNNQIEWIYLKGDFETIRNRMEKRDHFMKPDLLQSQFDDLEPPSYGVHISMNQDLEEIISQILQSLPSKSLSQFGIIGMGVMGRSLAKNALSKGISVSVFNRYNETEKEVIPQFLTEVKDFQAQGYTELTEFVASLESPKKILLMVPAGDPVDEMIHRLMPLLTANDIVMDGGNSHYLDTQRRELLLQKQGMNYLGIGISGGEQGALKGPSMMVGGAQKPFHLAKPILDVIAAKDDQGNSCAAHLGPNGAGHFIKTIHNGIEYGEMQLLAEVYAILRPNLNNEEIANVLTEWNQGELSGYLLEITIDILQKREGTDYLLDKVLDKAVGKGTGTWSGLSALELGMPTSIMIAAVLARSLSNLKVQREQLSKQLENLPFVATMDIEKLRSAYQFARIINHHQGLQLIAVKSKEQEWNVDLTEVVRIWTNGCILRSNLLKMLIPLLRSSNDLLNHSEVFKQLRQSETDLSEVLLIGMEQRTPLPCFSNALQYWYGMTEQSSSANLIQAQRDAFGAHSYKRIDRPENESFTTNWHLHG